MSDDFPIESRFTLQSIIGRGGSGDVHLATDRATGLRVAVKRLLAAHEEPTLLDRFRREARLLANIQDPHVVSYVAHGVDKGGRPCLVVEWLEGEDIAHRQKRQRLTVPEALDVGYQTALGLHALHRAGIVHRDVKPANIFLAARDDGKIHVKLIDLGIAHAAGEATLTMVGNMLGTPFYMAPEQARGEERVTTKADQFALGAVLFELLSGKRAFSGDDVFAILAKIVLSEPPRLREAMPGVPPQLDALVRRTMNKAPEDRFPSARDLADAIAALPPWSPDVSPAAALDIDEPATRVAAMSSTWERRVVTALFAGFPIALRDDDLHAFEAVAAEHGASTHPTLGRRLIAVFGGARTTGDEVLRAARAAIAARDRIPGVRLAIATGRALAGLTGLSGDIIERGARVVQRGAPRPEGAAPILIDEATAQLLTEHFVVEGPKEARMLSGVRPGAAPPRTLVGKPTPCVGRDRELVSLGTMFAECAMEPMARAVLVTGPAGIGKSRLRYELLSRIARHESEPEVIVARGSPLAEASAFGLLAPALRRLAGILDGEPAAAQRRKLAARIGRHAPATVADRIADVAMVPGADTRHDAAALPRFDAMQSGDRMRAAWIAWLDAECAAHPVVLALEDLHWGDLTSVMLIDAALRSLEGRPLFVVALARPEIHERFPSLWAGRGVEEMKLGPLTPRAAERLVRATLGEGANPSAVQRIVARGEGNAFYLEELIRAVAEGADEALPDTVLGMVQARLDALGGETKKVLRAASLFGQVFWRGGAAALVGEAPSGIDAAIERLIAAEVVQRRASAVFPGEEELVFRHALVREAAYAMIPDVDRRAGHRRAGAWLEEAGEVDPVLLGTHFERGGDLERAAGFYLRAAIAALAGNDFAGAIAHAEHSIELGSHGAGPIDPAPRRGRARLIQAEAHRWRGNLGPAATAGAEAADLLPRGSPAWFHAVRETIAASGRLGQFDRVEMWANEALACDANEDATSARVTCLAPAAGHFFYSGRSDAGLRLLEQLEAIAAAAGTLDPAVGARLNQVRAMRADLRGDLEGAVEHHRATLACFEKAGDLRGACQTLSNLGYILAVVGDFEESGAMLARAQQEAERMGLGMTVALANHNLGGVLAALGRLDDAREVEQLAVDAFQAAGDPRLEGASRVYLSRIHLAAGDLAGAEAEARRVADNPASPAPSRAGALAALALALLASGRAAEALGPAVEAADTLASLGAIEDFDGLVRIAHAEALAANGDLAGARATIEMARARVLDRASRLHEPTKTRFLSAVPDNARCLALAAAWSAGAPAT